jgi:hypothetical protein
MRHAEDKRWAGDETRAYPLGGHWLARSWVFPLGMPSIESGHDHGGASAVASTVPLSGPLAAETPRFLRPLVSGTTRLHQGGGRTGSRARDRVGRFPALCHHGRSRWHSAGLAMAQTSRIASAGLPGPECSKQPFAGRRRESEVRFAPPPVVPAQNPTVSTLIPWMHWAVGRIFR